ncbi:efflux RND transporter periplasmic adaptor subunit [Paraburkholderia sp. Cpub6]|uniref:efflux RND transporter periplasmic adaptor subunit n=1 Tax=Paraburkholderia sp. Cpub6 TaxID=2723094 RepID=UPI0016147C8D|nr:efflux RND transporter periplasmic adaptor subunit [Paraburkholderia sp. Cpub6]MBB5462433.1 RND family efflux transporter MFP subunit [Paraburkholderia sp. Cpub6]
MKTALSRALPAIWIAAMVSGCSHKPPPEALRAVRTAEIRYDKAQETDRYFGSVQSRYEVDQAFRVGGKVVSRKVDVGQKVHQGDVLAVLDGTDYKLAVQAAQEQLAAAQAQARQAESDRKRLEALKVDGSVSPSDDEKAQSNAQTTRSVAEADARSLDLARNRLEYTTLRASQDGVVTSVKFEAGQVVAEGQPIVSIAKEGDPEIVVNVPEDQLQSFKTSRYKAWLASASAETFDVVLRELSPQAAAQTRTFRARLKPATPRSLPLGATATLVVERPAEQNDAAAIPAAAITQNKGRPAVWVVRREGTEAIGKVDVMPVAVRGYRNDDVLVSGLPAGELVVTAGVQKMAPGLKVALPGVASNLEPKKASDEVVQPH